MKNILISAIFLFTLGILSSCNFNYFENDIADFSFNDLEVKAPIGYLEYSVEDLLKKLEIEELQLNNDGTLVLTKTETVEEEDNESYDVPIINHTFKNSVNTSISGSTFPVQFPYTLQEEDIAALPTNSIEMQFIENLTLNKKLSGASFTSGGLILSIESTFQSDMNIIVTIPTIINKSDNSAYSKTITLKGAQSEEVYVDLNEYDANFTHNGITFDKNTSNNLVINTIANITYKPGDIINTTDKINYNLSIEDTETEVIYCDFENEPFSFEKNISLDIDFYKKYSENIDFIDTDAELNLIVKNGYGFPLGVLLTGIEANNDVDAPINLSYTSIIPEEIAIGNKFIIDGLTSYSNTEQDNVTSQLTLNRDNSNINELIALKPKSINLLVSGNANPIDNNPNKNFFAINNNGLSADITLTVPVSVKFTDLKLELDPEPFELSEEIKNIKNFNLIVTTSNQIPLSGKINLIFLNNGTSIGLEKNINLFDSAPVDTNGISNGTTNGVNNILLTTEEFNLLETANEIQLDITFNSTPNAQFIVLKGENTIKVGIATDVTIAGNKLSNNQ